MKEAFRAETVALHSPRLSTCRGVEQEEGATR